MEKISGTGNNRPAEYGVKLYIKKICEKNEILHKIYSWLAITMSLFIC